MRFSLCELHRSRVRDAAGPTVRTEFSGRLLAPWGARLFRKEGTHQDGCSAARSISAAVSITRWQSQDKTLPPAFGLSPSKSTLPPARLALLDDVYAASRTGYVLIDLTGAVKSSDVVPKAVNQSDASVASRTSGR
jgi:hypothetical protein